eukprot:4533944-Prymnesium_polylepis.2
MSHVPHCHSSSSPKRRALGDAGVALASFILLALVLVLLALLLFGLCPPRRRSTSSPPHHHQPSTSWPPSPSSSSRGTFRRLRCGHTPATRAGSGRLGQRALALLVC